MIITRDDFKDRKSKRHLFFIKLKFSDFKGMERNIATPEAAKEIIDNHSVLVKEDIKLIRIITKNTQVSPIGFSRETFKNEEDWFEKFNIVVFSSIGYLLLHVYVALRETPRYIKMNDQEFLISFDLEVQLWDAMIIATVYTIKE